MNECWPGSADAIRVSFPVTGQKNEKLNGLEASGEGKCRENSVEERWLPFCAARLEWQQVPLAL